MSSTKNKKIKNENFIKISIFKLCILLNYNLVFIIFYKICIEIKLKK